MTAIVIGCGCTSASTSANGIASPCASRFQVNGGISSAASIALFLKRDAHLGERKDFEVDVREREAFALQHLAGLVGRDRALPVARDRTAFQVLQAFHRVLELRPEHQVVPDRRRDAVGQDGDGQVLLQRVEDAGRDAAGDDLVLVLRQERDDVRGGVDVVPFELDAGFLEVAVLERHQLGGVRGRARDADLDGRPRAAAAPQPAAPSAASKTHDNTLMVILPGRCRLFGCRAWA